MRYGNVELDRAEGLRQSADFAAGFDRESLPPARIALERYPVDDAAGIDRNAAGAAADRSARESDHESAGVHRIAAAARQTRFAMGDYARCAGVDQRSRSRWLRGLSVTNARDRPDVESQNRCVTPRTMLSNPERWPVFCRNSPVKM